MADKRVLSVGQCWADHGSISYLLKQLGAEVRKADTASEALARLREESVDLVLVNRILDGDGSRGVELIRQIKADETLSSLPVMLVSNYDDAQAEAQQAGAIKGFGKGALGHPQTAERVRLALVAKENA